MDISGEVQRDITHNVLKVRLDSHGAEIPNTHTNELQGDLAKVKASRSEGYCGSCYGGHVDSGCCNTCEDVRRGYANMGWSFNNPEAIEQVCVDAFHY